METTKQIASHTNYFNPNVNYLKNVTITEWDLHAAGLSVLKYKKLVPQETLDRLSSISKHRRTVEEGLLQKKDKRIASEIITTLQEIVCEFLDANGLTENDILTIKKDAVFVINKTPTVRKFHEYFEFTRRDSYTSYIRLNGKEFYYNSTYNRLEVKGLPEDAVERQKEFLLKDISRILRSCERLPSEQIYTILKTYRSKYLTKQLPHEVYRELDTASYRVTPYLFENVTDDVFDDVDIRTLFHMIKSL